VNWRGRPLTSHEVVVELIAATSSKTGLRVHAERDHGVYPTNVQISDADMAAIGLLPHDFHGDWNYTFDPTLTVQAVQIIPPKTPIVDWAHDTETNGQRRHRCR
jgi:hypothetical protein